MCRPTRKMKKQTKKYSRWSTNVLLAGGPSAPWITNTGHSSLWEACRALVQACEYTSKHTHTLCMKEEESIDTTKKVDVCIWRVHVQLFLLLLCIKRLSCLFPDARRHCLRWNGLTMVALSSKLITTATSTTSPPVVSRPVVILPRTRRSFGSRSSTDRSWSWGAISASWVPSHLGQPKPTLCATGPPMRSSMWSRPAPAPIFSKVRTH